MDPYLTPSSDSTSSSNFYLRQQQPITCGHCKRLLQFPPQLSDSEVFSIPCCANCQKVFYCSASHKKAHTSKHEKAGCFPAIVQSSQECGRYWIASRDIAIDEVIYVDKALVVGPNVPCLSPLYPTCLGCCRRTNTSYRCSKCGWPMCSKKCEKISNHSKYECKVFKKNKVEPNWRPQYYFFIQFLRSILMREQDPQGFAQLMELEPHLQARKEQKEEVFMLKSFYKFLTEDCDMDYDFDFVDQVVGVNRVNCYSADGLINGRKRFCTAVFPKLSLINHNCRPNTRTILHERTTGTLLMELRASVNIRQGEEISQQYITSTKGTFQRQHTLSEDWFFHCQCERCKDSTELNTFFSAKKCVNCSEGYLLPEDPLTLDSPWRCGLIAPSTEEDYYKAHVIDQGCGYSKNCENVKCLITEIDRKRKQAEYNPKAMERLLGDLTSHSLHPNHFLIVNMKFGIVDDIVRKINYPPGCHSRNERDGMLSAEVSYEEIMKAIKYTKDILAVTRVICPGSTYSVGVILYFLGSCLIELKLRNSACKFTDTQVENVVKEAWEILRVEADGTSYREMVKVLEEKSLVMNMESLSF